MENYYKGHELFSTFVWVLATRLISGIASGMAHLTVTVHASDIGSKRMRQVISYVITTTVALSVAFYSYMMNVWYNNDFPTTPKFYIGFNVIVIGVLALLLTPMLTNETVPFYLVRGKETKALKKFAKLNGERKPRAKTVQKFNEFKRMVEEDVQNGHGILSGGNLTPLYIVLNARLLHLFISSVPMLMLVMSEMGSWRALKFQSFDGGFLTESSAARIIVGTIVMAVASWCGRHKFIYIATILASGMFLVGFLQNMHLSWDARHTLRVMLSYFVPVAHTLLSYGVDYYQMKQSVEAFPVTKKAWSLATIATVEHLIHAGLIAIFIHRLEEVKILIAGAIILLSIVSAAKVPDTRTLSLRATRNLFNGFMPLVNAV